MTFVTDYPFFRIYLCHINLEKTIMKKIYLMLLLGIVFFDAFSQEKEKKKWVNRVKTDTSATLLNMDAVYNRPFLQFGKIPDSVGGYVETNTSYFRTDVISD